MRKVNWIIIKSKDRGSDYGVGTFIRHLSNGLKKYRNIEVFILEIDTAKKIEYNRRKNEGGVTFIEISINDDAISSLGNFRKFSKSVARVVKTCIPEGIKTVIHMNYLIHYFVAIELKCALLGKIIFTQHVFTSERKFSAFNFDLESVAYEAVDKIITVTNHGKYHLISRGAPVEKIKVIYNGIDSTQFISTEINIREKYGLPMNRKLILFSGRIDNIKGLDYLCLAMELLVKRIPDCLLIIAGDGDFQRLISKSRKFSANISYLGFIPFKDVVALYYDADIGVIPSLEEHCSYVALEMLHCGLPVVASDLGGLKEIFIQKENALLTEIVVDNSNIFGIAPSVKQLEDNMFYLLNDEKIRISFSQNAKKRALSMFSDKIMVKNYLKAFSDINNVN